jgi:hypothetical protein
VLFLGRVLAVAEFLAVAEALEATAYALAVAEVTRSHREKKFISR